MAAGSLGVPIKKKGVTFEFSNFRLSERSKETRGRGQRGTNNINASSRILVVTIINTAVVAIRDATSECHTTAENQLLWSTCSSKPRVKGPRVERGRGHPQDEVVVCSSTDSLINILLIVLDL